MRSGASPFFFSVGLLGCSKNHGGLMGKYLIFTDVHIVGAGETIIDLDPAVRLTQGLAHAVHHHPDAKAVIIAGDLTHHGLPSEYTRLAEVLDECPLPVHVMLGNHDYRPSFRKVFTQAPDVDGFVQFAIHDGDHVILCLDTKDQTAPDHHSGLLCETRLDWLAAHLETHADKQVTLIAHHPAFDTGFTGMDRIKLHNGAEFRDLIAQHPCVKQLIHGHVHRTIMGQTNGVAVAMLKSTCHQIPMCLGDDDTSLAVDEPGAYGVLLLNEREILVLPEDFTLPPRAVKSDAHSS